MGSAVNRVQPYDLAGKVEINNLLGALFVDQVAFETAGSHGRDRTKSLARPVDVLTRTQWAGTFDDLFKTKGFSFVEIARQANLTE